LSSILLGWLHDEKIFRECSKHGFRRETDFKKVSPERLTEKRILGRPTCTWENIKNFKETGFTKDGLDSSCSGLRSMAGFVKTAMNLQATLKWVIFFTE
jgi:hypothetical protein